MSRIAVAAFQDLITAELPLVIPFGISAEQIDDGAARLRMAFRPEIVRPGGTISGPALMMLADVAIYAAVLGRIGLVRMAVTTNLNINFLRLPPQADVIAEADLIKTGRRLAVAQVSMRSAGNDDLVAHATGTYSIPPDAAAGV